MSRIWRLLVMVILGDCLALACGCASAGKPPLDPQLPPAPQYPPDHRYTLDELIELSVHRNASLDVARYEALAAKGLVDSVKSLWLPRLHYGFALLFYDNDLNYKVRAFDLVSINVPITAAYNVENSAIFAQIISTGGKRTSGLKQAKMYEAIQKIQVLVQQDAVAFDVANYYYLVCLASDVDAAIEDATRRIRVFQQVSVDLNERGSLRANNLDAMEAEFIALQLEQLRIVAQAGRQQAYEALKQAVGLTRNEPLVLKQISLPPPVTYQEAVSVSAAIVKGFLHRPENQQVDLFAHLRGEQVKFAKAAFAPNVAFAGTYTNSQGNKYNILGQIEGFIASLIVDAPVYEPATRAGLLQALGLEQASLAFQRQIEELITLEIEVTAIDAQKALAIAFKTARAKQIAAQHDQASRQAYSRDLIPASGVVIGIIFDTLARLQHLQALYGYHNARARLNRVTADRNAHYE